MQRSLRYLSIVLACSCALITACEVVLPIKEMAEAKVAISHAAAYKAATYAPDEFKAAEKALYDSHDFIKNGKEKEAKSSAEESKKKADEAYAKAIPLLAKDTIAQARTSLDESKAAFSVEFAKNETDAADAKISEANTEYTASNWLPAYEKGLEAIKLSSKVKDALAAQLPVLKAKLAALQDARAELNARKAAEVAPDDMASLDGHLAGASKAIDSASVKAAFDDLAAAENLARTIESKMAVALVVQKIALADAGLASVLAEPAAGEFADNTKKATELIAAAKTSLSEEKLSTADASANEALAVIDSIRIALEKKKNEKPVVVEKPVVEEPVIEKPAIVVTPPPAEVVEYVVKYRPKNTDCLWRIAEKVYKNAKMWPLIFMANRNQIKDPDLIYPGQKLIIPAIPEKVQSTKPVTPSVDLNKDTKKPAPDAEKKPNVPANQPTADKPQKDTAPPVGDTAPLSDGSAPATTGAADVPKPVNGNAAPAEGAAK